MNNHNLYSCVYNLCLYVSLRQSCDIPFRVSKEIDIFFFTLSRFKVGDIVVFLIIVRDKSWSYILLSSYVTLVPFGYLFECYYLLNIIKLRFVSDNLFFQTSFICVCSILCPLIFLSFINYLILWCVVFLITISSRRVVFIIMNM